MPTLIVLIACVGAALVGGVFFAFSTFVMRALAQLPPHQGIAAMQRINIVVLNPVFLSTFVGTALLTGFCALIACLTWEAPRSLWLLSSGVLYVIGAFLVTLLFNIPRNDKLARFNSASTEASIYWTQYVREWSNWNHVRTLMAIASAGCSAMALTS